MGRRGRGSVSLDYFKVYKYSLLYCAGRFNNNLCLNGEKKKKVDKEIQGEKEKKPSGVLMAAAAADSPVLIYFQPHPYDADEGKMNGKAACCLSLLRLIFSSDFLGSFK